MSNPHHDDWSPGNTIRASHGGVEGMHAVDLVHIECGNHLLNLEALVRSTLTDRWTVCVPLGALNAGRPDSLDLLT